MFHGDAVSRGSPHSPRCGNAHRGDPAVAVGGRYMAPGWGATTIY